MSTTLFNIAWLIVVSGAMILLVVRSRDRKARDRDDAARVREDRAPASVDAPRAPDAPKRTPER